MVWVTVASEARTAPLIHRCFHVRPWETHVYVVSGVRGYGRVLDLIGWNRIIARARGSNATRAGLPVLDQHTRRSEAGHLACLLVTLVLAGFIAVTEQWQGAGWLLGLGVVLHLYPVMLQRLYRGRIQAVLARGRER